MKTVKIILAVAVLAAIAWLLLRDRGAAKTENARTAVELSGAGATFPQPFYTLAFEHFAHDTGNEISYGGIGSGGGVRNLKDQIVDFAGSDAFLTDEEMAQMDPVVHVPTCMGAVVVAYNLPQIDSLKLSGEVVADIFAGTVTRWNDARIAELNPGLALPDKAIIPAFRSDGSGTTFVFTDYLSKVSPAWRARYGAGKSVNFPVGQAAKGNPGVAGVIDQTAYSIGYIGSEYAFAQHIPYAALRNRRGEFVMPSAASISAAAQGEMPADTRTSITDADAAGAYPISCFTWIVVYREQHYADRSADQARATVELLDYLLGEPVQRMTAEVNYAPLPEKAVELSRRNLRTITYDGAPILE